VSLRRAPSRPWGFINNFGAPRVTTGKALFLLDCLITLLIWPVVLRYGCWGSECFDATPDGLATVLYPAANIVSLYALGLYRRDAIMNTRESLARVPLAVSLGAVATACGLAMLAPWIGAPTNRVRLFAGAMLGFAVAGILARALFWALKSGGVFRRKLLVVGAGERARDLVTMLDAEGANPHYEITFLQDAAYGELDPDLARTKSERILQAGEDEILAVARRMQPDEIIVAPDDRRGMRLESLLACKREGFPVVQYLSFIEHEIRRVDVRRIDLGWLLYSEGFYFGVIDNTLKRMLDVVVSVLLLVLFSPFLIGAAIAVTLDDRGPIFYSQERVTRNDKPFRIYKLRTMRVDAEKAGAVWASVRDPRITRVGNFLRQSRIDEMPQLWNVLRGDMSLVGPRPERPHFVGELAQHLPLYHERHMVKAGLTGWAQINYPYGASIEDARAKLSYDLYYVKNFSVLFDLLIILQTLRVVLWPSGAR
jgi:sugar transferase (PEP-CTERM system associated)